MRCGSLNTEREKKCQALRFRSILTYSQGVFVVYADLLIDRFRVLLGWADDQPIDGEALIGVLQRFRPDGTGLSGLFDDLPMGTELAARLARLYAVAGDSRRPGGGQDAYFLVRNPPRLDPDEAAEAANRWLTALADLANRSGNDDVREILDPLPEVRVLEGLAPKQSKSDLKTVPLYRLLKREAGEWSPSIASEDELSQLLGPAYYFAACDWALRDYLLWPIYAAVDDQSDPFAHYFRLWEHGAKLRSFSTDRLDIYLPHEKGQAVLSMRQV